MDWREAALETDSFADVGGGGGRATRRSTSTGWKRGEAGLAEHLLDQLHGIGGTVGRLAEAIVHELEETGYLDTPLDVIAEAMRSDARARPRRRWRWSSRSTRRASPRAPWPNASRSRPGRPTATTRRWRG